MSARPSRRPAGVVVAFAMLVALVAAPTASAAPSKR